MRIVHVETGRHLYGGALQVVHLLRGLTAHGVDNTLVCSTDSAIADAAAETGARIEPMPVRGEFDPGFLMRLRRLLSHRGPDLVHLHSRRGADVMGGVAGRLARVPVVLSRRVDNPESRRIVAWKYRLYDRVITISHAIYRVLESEGVPADKLRCVHSAVDVDQYRPGGDREWFVGEFELPREARTVGIVAQLIERKGHRYLLDAVPGILERHPDTHFLMFGRGPLESTLRERIERDGLADRVRLVGFRDDLPRVLPCLDVVAHPAEMEGLGVSLLQVAACGVPIVGGARGGIPEIVHDEVNGFLIEPGDREVLVDRIGRLLADRDLAGRMGTQGRRIAEEQFSIDAMVAGNLVVYRSLLEGPGRQSMAVS